MSKRQLKTGEGVDAAKPEPDGAPAAKRLHVEAEPATHPAAAAAAAAADAAESEGPAAAVGEAEPHAAAAAAADAADAESVDIKPALVGGGPSDGGSKSPRSSMAAALAAKIGGGAGGSAGAGAGGGAGGAGGAAAAAAAAAGASPSQEQLLREYAALQAQQTALAQIAAATPSASAGAGAAGAAGAGAQRSLTARVMTDARSCGALIGKNGAVIQKFREQTGAQMEVAEQVAGATKRIVTVKGEVDRVATAISMIAIRLAEREGDGAVTPAPTNVAVTILVSKQQAGVIIGRGGMVINATRDASRAVIKIAEMTLGDSEEKEVMIRGTPDQLAMAVVILCNQLADIPDAPYRRFTPGPEVTDPYAAFYSAAAGLSAGAAVARGGTFGQDRRTVHINVPEFLCGAVLGKGGARINEIRQRSAADVKLGKPNAAQTDRLLTIIGSRQAVELAVSYVYETVEGVDPNSGKPLGAGGAAAGSAGAGAGSGVNAAQHAATLAQLIVAQQQLYASNASVIGTPTPTMAPATMASQAYAPAAAAAAGYGAAAYGAGTGAAYGGGAGGAAGYGAGAQWQQYQALLEQQQHAAAAAAASAYGGAAAYPTGGYHK